MGSIGAKDLSGGSDGEPLNVLDLPQIYTKPSYTTLLNTLLALKTTSLKSGFRPLSSSVESPQSRTAIATYLTQIISSGLSWLSEPEQERILDEASLRLSERSGRTAMPSMTRVFSIPTSHRGALALDIHEPSLTGDDLGFKTWGSAYVLASRLEELGSRHVHPSSSSSPTRVLELGAGTGLVGLAAAAVWQCEVVLTDLKGIVSNTKRNVELNRDVIGLWGGTVNVDVLDWSEHPEVFALGEEFDVVLAADPLYDPSHAPMLTRTIAKYLSSAPSARVIVELPLRDQATEIMAAELRALLDQHEFVLLESGEEEVFDDWESDSDATGVKCWWGVWRRAF